ncbi:DUF4012 domain-containing protein [Pseudarthrobacter niigatensis]|uniref:DUF4012 domain-containing protein n=1 Tax=Pseudarthrobacter niigatensis TaxID=369935 RepID=A0AAJ1SUK4_9MICC|nr:DUF4012 domain-containing protein [Pseudarthrobacter niigatensis]MDQ0145999.1 hypothetical protein [Pseudarthrobacter niigatensis]MDQ0266273.1 hypothetical protein [Pseudarthrobacter niigatensis]
MQRNYWAAHQKTKTPRHAARRYFFIGLGGILLIGVALCGWLGFRAAVIRNELQSAIQLVPPLRESLTGDGKERATEITQQLTAHTAAAREASNDPWWTMASGLPWLGNNISAISEMARSADDVAALGLKPLVQVYDSLDWEVLVPSDSGADLTPLVQASTKVKASAGAVRLSADRLKGIDNARLVPDISEPLGDAKQQLTEIADALDVAADAAQISPQMLGVDGPRTYLLIIQNNAESRASGGIPGALAAMTVDHGKLSLGIQSSAGDVGIMSPPLPVDRQQQQIYSGRLGKYMQDVNLTPDFPTAAATARGMWEQKTGQRVDGVISIDPVVLSYILQSTGPVPVGGPELAAFKAAGLPTELTGSNVVATLLSEVYAKVQQPRLQDAYFAGVAKEVFSAFSSGKAEAKGLINGLTRGVEERRVLVWSANSPEEAIITKYALGGSTSGPSVSASQFGVYFNDGTGAKMDYYVKRTVQLIKDCPADGYEQTTVRISSTNTAPADASTSLPPYVTGGGAFGVAPGSVQTNIVVYGPVQANVESATTNGQKIPFAPYLHAMRPVGVVAQQLAPGESKTVDFTFGKIVQHTEPNVVVTPTVQHVKDVILPTENASCNLGQ